MAKILVVDDEKNICEEFCDLLQEDHHEVDFALNGIDALKMFEENNYDLVFLDVLMPRMEGRQVFEEMRKIKQIPIALMSGYMPPHKERDVLSLGAIACLKKPFNVATVKQLIQSVEAKKSQS